MRLIRGISGHIVDLDKADLKRCSICRVWFQRARLRANTYCATCNNDYQRWRRQMRRVDLTSLHYTVHDIGVQTFRELYMSGILGHTHGAHFTPWIDKWHPGLNDHIVPEGAVAVVDFWAV
jgi:hypothetical protein